MNKQYYVYIATNKINSVLYTGMTNSISRRVYEHKNKLIPGFTSKYNINKLVYLESFNTPEEAIVAEKKIKGWTRGKKICHIKENNPDINDLSDEILRYHSG